MQLGSLKVFCDVARQRSFSQAAQANDITQSAVSQIVATLEKSMAVQLIDRSTRPLPVTALGRPYYEGCKALVGRDAELEGSIHAPQRHSPGEWKVSATSSV